MITIGNHSWMKRLIIKSTYILLLTLCFTGIGISQDISGRWYSKATLNQKETHFLFDIRKNNNSFLGYIDLPSEQLFRLQMDSISFANNTVIVQLNTLDIHFKGQFDTLEKVIHGHIRKDENISPLVLLRTPQVKRTQLIVEHVPYESKDIFFYNQDSTRLAGTLTYPKKGAFFKAVILISGSGPQNRDSEILGHKPFKVLADYLTRRGIAVLRYDDRGYGASQGQFRPATTMDYSFDALAAVQYLKHCSEITINKIGLIGHSEGGNIAPIVATKNAAVDFIILLAAPGTSNYKSYLNSLDLLLKEYPETYDRDYPFFKSVYKDMASIHETDMLKKNLQSKFEYIANLMSEEELSVYGGKKNYIQSQVTYHSSRWYHSYLRFDVTGYLKKLKIPILALNGDKDHSVVADYNLKELEKTLKDSGNTQFDIVELSNVNHFFQVSNDSKIESVYFNQETFSKKALIKIGQWIEEL